MKVITSIGLIPLFACWLCAQSDQTTRSENSSTTTTTMYGGTLIDEGCHNTRTEHHESSSTDNPDTGSHTTTNSSSTRVTSDCPVTTETKTFGLLTPEGQYIRFDQPSNAKIIEVVKGNKTRYIDATDPVKVQVKGSKKGDVVVIDSIQ
jgi:hypothetical protein